jgi:hypothetical protein
LPSFGRARRTSPIEGSATPDAARGGAPTNPTARLLVFSYVDQIVFAMIGKKQRHLPVTDLLKQCPSSLSIWG